MDAECRLCLEISDDILHIFFDCLHNKITTISSLEILPNDGFPKTICQECVKIVHQLHDFRTQIIKSRKTREENPNLSGSECRVCLKTNEDEKFLDVLSDGLPHKIETISSVEVSPDDGFSKNICAMCVKNVESLYRFRNTIISSWNILVERRFNIEIKEETLEEPTVTVKPRYHLYKCVKCDFLTPSSIAWKIHLERHEDQSNLCEFCGEAVSIVQFTEHLEQHTESFVKCNICGKTFKNEKMLLYHISTHTQKKVECPQCGIVLKPLSLSAHMLRHRRANDKPNKCSICESQFHESDGLKRHMRSHTGERPYICKTCSKGFSSAGALKTHVRQHTQEKPYKCDYCDAAFKQAVLVRRHLKSKHPEKVVQKSGS